jgi:hypothetical protein
MTRSYANAAGSRAGQHDHKQHRCTTRLGGMTTPPWREITTDDYHWRTHATPHSIDAWMAQALRIRDLLQRQIDGEFRLRLVLREVVDLKRGAKRDPNQIWDYDMGATTITGAAEIVIERNTGLRQVVQLARSGTKARMCGRMACQAQ